MNGCVGQGETDTVTQSQSQNQPQERTHLPTDERLGEEEEEKETGDIVCVLVSFRPVCCMSVVVVIVYTLPSLCYQHRIARRPLSVAMFVDTSALHLYEYTKMLCSQLD